MENILGVLGLLFMLSPFVITVILSARVVGWKTAFLISGSVIGLFSFIFLGVYMLKLAGWLK